MRLVTLRVLDGADRGRVFANLATPVTIGREEGNVVQLNDERVSRYHVKIQEDQDKLVLADLQSTNGTRVNGESVHLSLLRPGDIINMGRTLLLVGSDQEIAERLADLRKTNLSEGVTLEFEDFSQSPSSASLDFELHWGHDPDALATLHTLLPPELPADLSPGQAAQLSGIFQYFHLRFRALVETVEMLRDGERVTLEQRQWQNVLDLYARLARYLRQIGEPTEE